MTHQIPTEQWAQVVEKVGGPVVLKKVPVAEPGPDEVLIHVKFSGVCHTDLHAMSGDWPLPTKLPLVGGHEGAGVVVKKGSLVTGIDIGDHAGIKWINNACLACSFCQQSDEPLCHSALLSGYTVDGTFQQYAIAKAAHVARIPATCDLEAISPVLCAGITVYKGLKESNTRPGQWVAIVGAGGGLGSMALQYAKAMGLQTIAIDTGAQKGESCKSLGASEYIDFNSCSDAAKAIKAATPDGYGPHAVLLLPAQESPYQHATEYVRSRGTVVCIGIPPDSFLKAPIFDVVTRMISIRGSYVGNRQDTQEAIEFFARGLIKVPYKTVGLSQLQEVYKLMQEGSIIGRYVVDTGK